MVNSVKCTLSPGPKISIKLIARMNNQVRGVTCNQWVSTEAFPCAGYHGEQNKQTSYETVPVNSKRLPCNLVEKIRHMLHDYAARRSIPTSPEENQSSYSVLRQHTRESGYSWQLPSSPSWAVNRSPVHTHYSDTADPLGSSPSLLTPFLFGVLQLSPWSRLFWLL